MIWRVCRRGTETFCVSWAQEKRAEDPPPLASPTSAMTPSFVIMVASGLAVVVRALKTTSTSNGKRISHNSSVRGEKTSSPSTLAPVRGLVSGRCSPISSTTCLKAKSVRVSLSPLNLDDCNCWQSVQLNRHFLVQGVHVGCDRESIAQSDRP